MLRSILFPSISYMMSILYPNWNKKRLEQTLNINTCYLFVILMIKNAQTFMHMVFFYAHGFQFKGQIVDWDVSPFHLSVQICPLDTR